ncbi:ABC transporter permease [Chloroflexota bacterium]
MRAYIIRRLLLLIPTFVLVTLIIFLTVRFIPGDVVELMIAENMESVGLGSDFTADILRKALGMDVPVHIQYGRWLGIWPQEGGGFSGIFQGSLGNSLWKEAPILDEFRARLPVSIEIGLIAIFISLMIALPIGIYSAIRQDTWGDYAGRTVSIVAISVPNFWLATMIVVYPSIWWGWTPSMQYIPLVEDLGGNLLQFIIPGALMGMLMSGTLMRITRTMMLEVLRQDYIRTAWAKGLRERTVILRHVLKNALIPVVTVVGMMLTIVIGGTVVIEQIFVLPGVGRFLYEAITTRDYPIISGINVVITSVVLIMNLVVDLAYAWMDPRVRYD